MVFDFLHRFRSHLGELASEDMLLLPRQLTEELVDSTGAEGLLAQVHVSVLNGVIHKGGLTPITWQAYLALRARYEKVNVDGTWQPLFKARKREEAYVYCHLPAARRCVRPGGVCPGVGVWASTLCWGCRGRFGDWGIGDNLGRVKWIDNNVKGTVCIASLPACFTHVTCMPCWKSVEKLTNLLVCVVYRHTPSHTQAAPATICL